MGSARYDLPLPADVARKWDALSERLYTRAVGRRGTVSVPDPRFVLIEVSRGRAAAPGSTVDSRSRFCARRVASGRM